MERMVRGVYEQKGVSEPRVSEPNSEGLQAKKHIRSFMHTQHS